MLQRLVKPFILVLVLVAAALVMLVSSGIPFRESSNMIESPPTGEGPRLEFAEQVADYGDVPIEETVDHSFEFTNTGDAPLLIEGNPTVQTVAGC